jgi:FkbM family methyltransferase
MNELSLLTMFTKKLPPIKGAGLVANYLKKIYLRKKRNPVVVNVNTINLELDPYECVDGSLLFYPQLYDRNEFKFLRENLSKGGVFLDIGSNIGYYSLEASLAMGKEGQVIVIEADPYNVNKILKNQKLNDIFFNVEQIGVGDKFEESVFYRNTLGHSGSTYIECDTHIKGEILKIEPLNNILKKYNLEKIDIMKIDIEGFEFRVLNKYFEESDSIKPKFILIEINNGYKSSQELPNLLIHDGYEIIENFTDNVIFK